MKITSYSLLFLFLCLLLISCQKDNTSYHLLKQAQTLIDTDPAKALTLLDSIRTPEDMDRDDYMQYIVAHVQAKYKTHQNITGDTIIFEAQKYFEDKGNLEQGALAHFYTGGVYSEKKMYAKSLKSFFNSYYYAKKIGDNNLSVKISDNIGALYFQQGVLDSAIIYYEKALGYYEENDSLSILRVSNLIGRSYEAMNKLDSAYSYFNRALTIAENLNNDQFKSQITQNLGLTSFGMDEYDKAIGYYQSVLSMKATGEDQKKQAYLYLLKIYTIKQDNNLAREYAAKVEASLPEVTYNHTTKEMYAALTNYYKLTGDYKQALHFKELESDTKDRIANEERPAEMIKADSNFRIEQNDKHFGEILSNFHLYLWASIIIIVGMVICIVLVRKQSKKDQKELDAQQERYNRYRERLQEMNAHYPDIEAEIKEMLRDSE